MSVVLVLLALWCLWLLWHGREDSPERRRRDALWDYHLEQLKESRATPVSTVRRKNERASESK